VGAVSGVYGQTDSTAGHGVTGWAKATSGDTAGVYGQTDSSTGTGGYFTNEGSNLGSDIVAGSGGGGTDGVISSDLAAPSSDLHLRANDDIRIDLDENNDEAGNFVVVNGLDEIVFRVDETNGWYGHWADEESDTTIRSRDNIYLHLNDDDTGSVGAIDIVNAADEICLVLTDDGNIYKRCGGTSSAVIETSDNVPRRLYVMESPEVWLEDFGFGKLAGGAATVNIDALFLSTINTTDVAYHVFVTPLGDCNGLYVTNKTATSFEVRELGGGTSEVEFEYRIIAKRLGWEDARMEPAPVGTQGSPVPSTKVDDEIATGPIIIDINDSEE